MAEEPEIEAPQAEPTTTADVALAAALDEARGNAELTPEVAAFFEAQTELARDQRHHMAAQFILEHKAKFLDNWSKRLKLVLQAITVMVAAIAVGALAVMAWNAHNDRGVVVEALDAPPDLTSAGLTGQVLAGELRDKIGLMQSQTAAPTTGADVRANRATEVKVEIPETGVSVGDIDRYLRDWLGRETHVGGDIVHIASGEDKGGLALTVRVGAGDGVRIARADGDVEALTQSAAEAIYGAIDSERYDRWLDEHGRTAEAIARTSATMDGLPPKQRAAAELTITQLALGAMPVTEASALLQDAVQLDPSNANAWNNLGVIEGNYIGHAERAHALFERARRTMAQAQGLSPQGRRLSDLLYDSNFNRQLGDYAPTWTLLCADYGVSPCTATTLTDHAVRTNVANSFDARANQRLGTAAAAMARDHDPVDAGRLMAASRREDPGRSPEYQAVTKASWLGAAIYLDREREDWDGLLRDAKALDDLDAGWPGLQGPTTPSVWRGYALARLGRQAEAEAAIASSPLDCQDCLRMRGLIAATKGDWPAVDHWFGEAVRQAPSIPFADAEWGQALLAKGDVAGAITKLEQAHKLGPRFADPLKFWGDALVRLGRPKDALAKYNVALKYAPTWAALHQVRDAAAKRVA